MSTTEFIIGLRSWKARAGFVLGKLAARAGLAPSLQHRLNGWVHGRFEGPSGVFDLRPGTLDAWTVHPKHERDTHETIRTLLGTRGGTMLDVGGYCAGFSLRYRDHFDRIVIFEPFPPNGDAVSRNIELSRAGEKVALVRAAVGAEQGRARLYLATSDTHSLVETGQADSIEVDVVTLDSSLANLGLSPSDVRLVKIDVEGGEVSVLRGATEVLKAGPIIVAEANTEAERSALEGFLAPHGYRLAATADHRNFIFTATGRQGAAASRTPL